MTDVALFWGFVVSALWLALGVGGMAVEWVAERCER